MLRFFSSSSSSIALTKRFRTTTLPLLITTQCFFSKLNNTTEYHNISETFIEDCSILSDKLLDECEEIEDSSMSDGVLQIKTSTKGTFVLNKQAPLHQIWYSSPISGPHHYDYDLETKRWVSDKDKHDLQEKIERELTQVLGGKKVVKF
jgi:frataxin